MNLNQNIIKKTYLFFISFLFIFFSCNSDDDHNVAVTGVNLDKEGLSLKVGAESILVATVTPTTATSKEVTWASDKPDIATVTKNGLVTAVAVGTATITVTTSADDTNKDTVTVTVTSTLTEFSIADVSVPRGTTSFVISPTLIPTEATVDYELITKPTGVTMAGTTINIAADMTIGEYNITVKAKGTGDYTGETETTFRLKIILNDDFVINFKDEKFKKAVKDSYKITANDVTYGDVKDRTNLDVSRKGITNMEEIRYFDSLTALYCYNNQLTSLDLSKNTDLERLYCDNNQLTSLDISKNTHLWYLSCSNNQLTSLDISKNTDLERLYCSNNQLTSLDLSRNTHLILMDCSNNQLTNLDISKNTNLILMHCFNNQLTNLDISKNTNLWDLYCGDNQLTNLDLSQNTVLKELQCYNNKLTSLDLSQNTVLKILQCYNNKLTSLDISQNTVLYNLNCSNTQLTSLDLSKNTKLRFLSCSNNQLTSLDLSQNTVLERLYCNNNQFTSLDLNKSAKLRFLNFAENPLTSLDIRGLRKAPWLRLNTATLETLKVHQNIKDNQSIIAFKTARGSNLTISTYSATAGSTTYELICNDYTPVAGGGSCNDE